MVRMSESLKKEGGGVSCKEMVIETRPDARQFVADGWAGAVLQKSL